MKCPCCDGECEFIEDKIDEVHYFIRNCYYCNGTGKVSLWKLIKWVLYIF